MDVLELINNLRNEYYLISEQPATAAKKSEAGDPMGGVGAGGATPPAPAAAPGGAPGAAGADPMAAGMGTDPMAGGAGGMGDPAMGGGFGMAPQPDPETPRNIGRLFEMQKIYFRLKAILAILVRDVNPKLVEIRQVTQDALDLFKVVVDNFQSYKDKLDNIILAFYRFIERVLKVLEKHHKIEYHEKSNRVEDGEKHGWDAHIVKPDKISGTSFNVI